MSYISANLNFLITTVKKAGTGLSRDFNEIEQLQSSVKGPKEFAATARDRVLKSLRMELQRGKPSYAIVVDGEKMPETPCVLVAPIDGETNFMHGIPSFSISVAVVENGQITSGVVFNPATAELCFAEKGQGAFREGFRNHERLRVSSRKDLGLSLVGLSEVETLPEIGASRVQGCVSLDLANVAAGRYDACVSRKCSAASVAAGVLLVKEAGGYVYELNQKDIRTDDVKSALESGNLIAVNGELGKKLHGLLN